MMMCVFLMVCAFVTLSVELWLLAPGFVLYCSCKSEMMMLPA
jgi:hypothetical protein